MYDSYLAAGRNVSRQDKINHFKTTLKHMQITPHPVSTVSFGIAMYSSRFLPEKASLLCRNIAGFIVASDENGSSGDVA